MNIHAPYEGASSLPTGLELFGALSEMTYKGIHGGSGLEGDVGVFDDGMPYVIAIRWSKDGRTLRCTIEKNTGGWITDDVEWSKIDFDWDIRKNRIQSQYFMDRAAYASFDEATHDSCASFDGTLRVREDMRIRWVKAGTTVASFAGMIEEASFSPTSPLLAIRMFNDVRLIDFSDLRDRIEAIERLSIQPSATREPKVSVVESPEFVAGETAPVPADSPLRVFLCHASEDKPRVRELFTQLQQDGFRPWLDDVDLLPGQNWGLEISKALQSSHTVIVCLSGRSTEKVGYIQKEIKMALDFFDKHPENSIYLIPARLEACGIPLRLRHLHAVDLFEKSGYSKLKASLRIRALSLQGKVAEA